MSPQNKNFMAQTKAQARRSVNNQSSRSSSGPCGTAYQTDVGMCGDYDSIIGMKKEAAILRFIKKMPGERLAPAEGEGTLCAAIVETDDKTGLAKSIKPVRIGGRLPPT